MSKDDKLGEVVSLDEVRTRRKEMDEHLAADALENPEDAYLLDFGLGMYDYSGPDDGTLEPRYAEPVGIFGSFKGS